MPVEDLVVDHENVGEGVDVAAVAVDDGDPTLRSPALHLAGPVDLHDVRHHRQHRVGPRHGGSEHRLGRLAEPWLVGEQEGSVPQAHLLQEAGLVHHQGRALRRDAVDGGRGWQVHRGGPATGPLLEGAVERVHEVPPGETAGETLALQGSPEVGSEERVGHHPRRDGCRNRRLGRGDPGGDHRRGGSRCRDDHLLGSQLGPRLDQPVESQPLSGRAGRVAIEQGQQAGVTGGHLGQDGRDAVEAFEQLGAGAGRDLGVTLDASAFGAHEQGDDLELRAVRRAHRATTDLGLDLAHPAGQDRDDRRRVVRARHGGASAGATGRPSTDIGRHAPPDGEV